ncbi:MAG TPA: serine hydrolase domain-containing protein, partial [Parvularculaceae bacterium]|nr:serine hydrolase domain-containing protein [Parvularculaceae bacterium]
STTTPYGIASMGKAVTAAAAMTLVQAGKLDLDANVADILGPEAVKIRAGERAPTVRELLNMTSGVPHGAVTYEGVEPVEENLVLANQSFVAFPAGSTFHYSNFSMALMERVIEKVSGRTYDAYVADAVFKPLRMKDALIGANAVGAVARYRADGARFASLTPYPRSSRQISASIDDLLKFAAMNLKTPVNDGVTPLSDKSIDIMQNEKSPLSGAHIALGIANLDLGDGERMIASSGNDMGVQSSMFLLPERGVGAVVLSNSSGYQTDEIAVSMLDAAAPGILEKFVGIATAFEERTTSFQPDGDWIGRWTGSIAGSGREIPVTIDIGDSGFTAAIDGTEAVMVDELSIRDGLVTGAFKGFLPLYEKPDGPHRIEINLIIEEDRLDGFMLANFRSTRGKFEIPAAVSLRRAD